MFWSSAGSSELLLYLSRILPRYTQGSITRATLEHARALHLTFENYARSTGDGGLSQVSLPSGKLSHRVELRFCISLSFFAQQKRRRKRALAETLRSRQLPKSDRVASEPTSDIAYSGGSLVLNEMECKVSNVKNKVLCVCSQQQPAD